MARVLTVSTGAVLVLTALAFAPVPAGDEPTLTSLATLPELNGATSVAVDGDVAYVSYRGGLAVVDIADPTAPQVVDRVLSAEPLLPDESIDIGPDLLVTGVDGGACGYPALGNCELKVLDRSDPRDIELVSVVALAHHNATCIDGCRYVLTDTGDIVDLGDPTVPVVMHSDVLADLDAHDLVEVQPGLVLVLSWSWTVTVVDVSTPTDPQVVLGARLENRTVPYRGVSNTLAWLGGADGRFLVTASNVTETDCDEDAPVLVAEIPGWESWRDGDGPGPSTIDLLAAHRWSGERSVRSFIDCATSADGHPAATTHAAMGNSEGGVELVEVLDDGGTASLAATTGQRNPVRLIWAQPGLLLSADAMHGLEIFAVQ